MNGIIKMTKHIPGASGSARTGAFGCFFFPAARKKNAKSSYMLGNAIKGRYNKDRNTPTIPALKGIL